MRNIVSTPNRTQIKNTNAQRGRLSLSRYVGESVLIYPKQQYAHLSAATLFSVPLAFQVDQIDGASAHLKITADKRLVVVRDEIFKQNHMFEPQSTWTDDALHRAFYRLAQEVLDDQTFANLRQKAFSKIA